MPKAKKKGLFDLLGGLADNMREGRRAGSTSTGNEAAEDAKRAAARYKKEQERKRKIKLKKKARKDRAKARGEYEPYKY